MNDLKIKYVADISDLPKYDTFRCKICLPEQVKKKIGIKKKTRNI